MALEGSSFNSALRCAALCCAVQRGFVLRGRGRGCVEFN